MAASMRGLRPFVAESLQVLRGGAVAGILVERALEAASSFGRVAEPRNRDAEVGLA